MRFDSGRHTVFRSRKCSKNDAVHPVSSNLPASFTVEAALLMPILFFSLFSVIYLTFHIHNAAALHANAAERTVTGTQQTAIHYMASEHQTLSVQNRKTHRTASYSASIMNYNDRLFGTVSGTVVYQKYDPTKELRCMLNTNER